MRALSSLAQLFVLSAAVRRFIGAFVLAILVAAAPAIYAADDATGGEQKEPPQLSSKAAEALGKVPPLIEAKNWEAAITALRGMLQTFTPGTYDMAMANRFLAQVYLLRGDRDLGDMHASLAPLVYVINSGYFDAKVARELALVVGQLYAMEEDYAQAEVYLDRWLQGNESPTAEGIIVYASLLINRAQHNGDKTKDRAAVEQALGLLDRGILLTANPQEMLFYLKVACFQELGRWDDAADFLEYLLTKYPKNNTYWSNLLGIYVQQERSLRAVITIERAQRLGLMQTPKDNLSLVSLYYNLQQYDRVIELLQKGLHDGSIESTKQNWELLGFAYQQMHRELAAIKTYEEAAKHFSTGQFDVLAGNLYYSMNRSPEALACLTRAIEKGDLDNGNSVILFAAYLSIDQKKIDQAERLLAKVKPLLKTEREHTDYNGLTDMITNLKRKRAEEAKAGESASKSG